ncbi:MAG: hypothetical protein IRY91_09940 [Gemmatimonadaceae bacterium]|nr:hypothetical protein [Gemmatimonadaceae bacterium]
MSVLPSRSRSAGRAPFAWAGGVTLLVVLGWLAALPPLIDGETRRAAAGAQLHHGVGYLLASPICDVMDALTLLSVRQTIALILSLIVLYVIARLVLRRRPSGVARELGLAAVALVGLIAFYAAGVFVPRPMAALVVADSDAVSIDFHSHTSYSHDARRGFGVAENLAWHRAAGFGVTYITDHKSFAGAAEGMLTNPARAGEGLVVLSGIEFVADHDHLNALGATARDTAWLRTATHDSGVPDPNGVEPVLLQTIPENLNRVPVPDAAGRHGVLAIELADGAPRGIDQAQRDRARILRIADSLDLAVVAASNNHGWGRTAVAWSVMRLPGWRALTPDALGRAIQDRIRTARRHAVQVIERRSPDPGRSRLALAATLPAVTWNLFRTLSPAQRLSWLAWAWGIAALVAARTSRRAPTPRGA